MSTEFHHYTPEEFLGEFFPDPADKTAVTAGMEQLRAEQRAWRQAETGDPGHPAHHARAGQALRWRRLSVDDGAGAVDSDTGTEGQHVL